MKYSIWYVVVKNDDDWSCRSVESTMIEVSESVYNSTYKFWSDHHPDNVKVDSGFGPTGNKILTIKFIYL